MEPSREFDVIEANHIDIQEEDAEAITDALNKHVATLIVAFHQFQKHHWLVSGPQHRDLHLFYEDVYQTVNERFDALAERVTALGAIPVSSPVAAERSSHIEHERSGEFDVVDMLKKDIDDLETVTTELRDTITTCRDLEDYGTAALLEDTLRDIEHIVDDIDKYLQPDTLQD